MRAWFVRLRRWFGLGPGGLAGLERAHDAAVEDLDRKLREAAVRFEVLARFTQSLRAPCSRCGQVSRRWAAKLRREGGRLGYVAICTDCERFENREHADLELVFPSEGRPLEPGAPEPIDEPATSGATAG